MSAVFYNYASFEEGSVGGRGLFEDLRYCCLKVSEFTCHWACYLLVCFLSIHRMGLWSFLRRRTEIISNMDFSYQL